MKLATKQAEQARAQARAEAKKKVVELISQQDYSVLGQWCSTYSMHLRSVSHACAVRRGDAIYIICYYSVYKFT